MTSGTCSWSWIEQQAAQTADLWHSCAHQTLAPPPQYSPAEQEQREHAYDTALAAAEDEARRTPRSKSARTAAQARLTAAFASFAANALDLPPAAVHLLTGGFLPVATNLARWARRFDPRLSRAGITQACRNAWTACGLQPLLGEPMRLTPSILGYSLLYPYSDNFFDDVQATAASKLRFSQRFRQRLCGEDYAPENPREAAIDRLVGLIEEQYSRTAFPDVFASLLAIHRAQEASLTQLRTPAHADAANILRISCAKGGSSVLADAFLIRGRLTADEIRFAFDWGVLLQLGDDLQDLREDRQRGSSTLFSSAAAQGVPLDSLVRQLLAYSRCVGDCMDRLPHGDPILKDLLRSSWQSLILMAVAESHSFFSPAFLQEAEHASPFRFAFLRARRDRLAGRQGLYTMFFDAFLEAGDEDPAQTPPARLAFPSRVLPGASSA